MTEHKFNAIVCLKIIFKKRNKVSEVILIQILF